MWNHWDVDLQNACWNGWRSRVRSGSEPVIVVLSLLFALGSWHESRITQDLYSQLLDFSQGRLLCESAFPEYRQVAERGSGEMVASNRCGHPFDFL
jgi:hypothetical protein